MKRKEDDQITSVQDTSLQLAIANGKWNEDITWEFILTEQKPEPGLTTAVCCITTFNGRVLLVQNKGHWEFPSGAIEDGESDEDAVIRETQEETGAIIQSPHFFGVRRLQARVPVQSIDKPQFTYPFPISYISYFHSETQSFVESLKDPEIRAVRLVTYDDALNLLNAEGGYRTILTHLRKGAVNLR